MSKFDDRYRRGDQVMVAVAGQLAPAIVVKIEGLSAVVCVDGEGFNDRRYEINQIQPIAGFTQHPEARIQDA